MITGLHHVSLKCGTPEEFEKARAFYTEVLGFGLRLEWPEGVLLDTGAGLIEIFSNGPGARVKGAVRHFALGTDDVDACAEKVRQAGYEVFLGPKDLEFASEPPFHARMAFCRGPLGEEIEFFQEMQGA